MIAFSRDETLRDGRHVLVTFELSDECNDKSCHCDISVTVGNRIEKARVYGTDALQALSLSFAKTWMIVQEIGGSGAALPERMGFQRVLSVDVTAVDAQAIHDMVDAELDKHRQETMRRRDERERAKAEGRPCEPLLQREVWAKEMFEPKFTGIQTLTKKAE